MKKKLASLRERIASNAVVQENVKPHEDANTLIKEAVGVLDETEKLVLKINTTNLSTRLADGRSLAQVIAVRDTLAQQHAILSTAIAGSKKEPDRYSMKEIKWVATMDVASLQKQSDDLSKQLRLINGLIQETNWKVEIE
jgi:hypothetical protein